MRVLIVSQYFYPESFRINAIAECLNGGGHNVTVLTGQPNYPEGVVYPGYSAWKVATEVGTPGMIVHRVPLVPRGKSSSSIKLVLNYFSFVISSIVFGSWLLRGQRFDVIFVYGASPVLQCLTGIFFRRMRKTPLVFWVQDLWPESLSATGYVKNQFLLDIVGTLVRWIYSRCDLLLSQSASFVEKISAMAPNVPIAYFPNPGDTTLDIVISESARVDLPNGFNILFAGNLGSVQSLETIIEAAALVSHVDGLNVVFLGSGSRYCWMQSEVRRQSLKNVFILGRVELPLALDAMKRSDALLVSLKNIENLNRTIPSKLPTYLGIGRPIIASMNGEGASLIAGSGAGIVCKAEDPRALANAMVLLKSLPIESRNKMGAAGMSLYQAQFELNVLTQTLLEHFGRSKYKNVGYQRSAISSKVDAQQ